MGKKKDQFIDKNKAITFKLSYRDNEDPFFKRQQVEGVNVERVFEIKSLPMDSSLTEEEIKKRDKLLSLFTETDQGIFEQKPREPQQVNKFWIPPEIRQKLVGKDLWIDQLAQKSQLQEQDVEDYEIEELEDVEEQGGEEEEFTDEENQEEEEEEIPTDKNQIKKKAPAQKKPEQKKQEEADQDIDTGSDDYSYDGEEDDDHVDDKKNQEEEEQNDDKPQKKIEDLTSEDFPDFKYKNIAQKKIVEENIIPKYDKLTFSKDVKFKKFNEYGLPATGFDYSKYFVQPNQQNDGVVEAILLADYKTAPKLKEDIDYEYEEMTEEQREVFDALNYDIEDDAYEELEDDFVQIATEGQQAIIQDLVEQEIEEEVTGKKKKIKGKKINFTFDDEGKIQLEMEKPSKKKVVKKVIKKYTQTDSKPSQNAVSEQDKEFEKVMKEMEDSQDGDNYNGSSDDEYDIPELKEGILTGEGFNKILDEHISEMSQRDKELLQKEERKIKSKQVNVEYEQKQKERLEQYKGYFKPEEIVTRKIYEPIPMDQDNALKSYIQREIERDEDPNYIDQDLERPQPEYQIDETIATKNFSFSRVHENLTFIGGNDISLSKSKRYKTLKHADEDEENAKKKGEENNVEQISEDEEEQEEEEEKDPLKVRSYELSKKIQRGETKEEKAARKQALKEFKDARKQKKKLFKDGFETLAKEHQSKFQVHTNHHNIQNVKGISIKQMI